MKHDTPVTRGAFASDGSSVVTLERQTCRVWKVGTGRPLGPPQTHEGRVETVALGPGGALVYTAESVREQKADKVRNVIWDTVSGQPKSQVGPVEKAIGCFSPDGTRLFLGSPNQVETGSVGVWDPSTGESIATIGFRPSEMGGVTDAAFSPDGRLLVVGFDRGPIMVYEAGTGQSLGPLKGRLGPFRGTDEDPDERVASQRTKRMREDLIRMVMVNPGSIISELTNRTRAEDSSPVALAISPEGQSVLIGFENGVAWLATLPALVPEERVPDWLVARTGTMLNPQATVDILKHEAWYQRWKASAPTE
jgi:WD40 repeat protein